MSIKGLLPILALGFIALPASAVTITFLPSQATFTPGGELVFNNGNEDGELNFDLTRNTLAPINLLGTPLFVNLGFMTLQEGDIQCGGGGGDECTPLSLSIAVGTDIAGTFTLSVNNTASRFNATDGDTDDGAADVVQNWAGLFQDRTYGTNGIIRMEIVGGDCLSGCGVPAAGIINWNDDDDQEQIWARFSLIQADTGASTPEPSSLVLIGGGLVGLGLLRRKIRR